MKEHEKIINKIAKIVLEPEGIFRVGSSRIRIDDNGWFFIVIEFQPSNYSKGTYLNVGINFLWESTPALNEILSFNYGGRVGYDFAEYSDAEEKEVNAFFQNEVETYTNVALEKTNEYRKFSNLDYAKEKLRELLENTEKSRVFWEIYNYAMLCLLKGDFEEGTKYFYAFLDQLKNSFFRDNHYINWHEELYNHCIEQIVPQLQNTTMAQSMVVDMINRRRNYFSSKSSYKKMSKTPFEI